MFDEWEKLHGIKVFIQACLIYFLIMSVSVGAWSIGILTALYISSFWFTSFASPLAFGSLMGLSGFVVLLIVAFTVWMTGDHL